MPFLDSNLVFCEDEAVAGDNILGDHLDLETHGANDAQLGYVYLNIQVDATGTDSNLFELYLRTADNSDLDTGAKNVVGVTTATITTKGKDWVKGDVFSFQVPTKQLDKHVGLYCITPSTDPAALKISAWLGMEPVADLNMQVEP